MKLIAPLIAVVMQARTSTPIQPRLHSAVRADVEVPTAAVVRVHCRLRVLARHLQPIPLAGEALALLKELASISLEMAQMVVSDGEGESLPNWLLIEIVRDLPRLVIKKVS